MIHSMAISYEKALAQARVVGAGKADNEGQIAQLCESVLPSMCGAVSPKLVFEGAIKKGMRATEFSRLMASDPLAIADLQWI